MATYSFDASNINPAADFDPLPDGEYPVIIIDSAFEPMKNGSGTSLKLTLQVIDGNFKDRLLWSRLSLQHTSEKAQDIAQRQLSAICHAVNVLQLSDTVQLHNRPLIAKVKFIAATSEYKAKNEISAYKPYTNGATFTQQAATAPAPTFTAPTAQPAQTSKGAPPWAAKAA